ncbi:MAG TPA: caspase family protein [Chryseosolibacter sp.]
MDTVSKTSVERKIIKVSAGADHVLALHDDGRVTGFGSNETGQLGFVSIAKAMDIAAGPKYSLILFEDGTLRGYGENSAGQRNPKLLAGKLKRISAGFAHALGLTTEGLVVAWGDNFHKQLSVPKTLTRAQAISAGGYHSMALTVDGSVVVWGNNDFKQLEVPKQLPKIKAIAAGGLHSLALTEGGTIVAWGYNKFGQCNIPESLTGVVAIAAGTNHSMAATATGKVYCWGQGTLGQTGVPTNFSGARLIAAGGNMSLAVNAMEVPNQLTPEILQTLYPKIFAPKNEFETNEAYKRRKLKQDKIVCARIFSSMRVIETSFDNLGLYDAEKEQFPLTVKGKEYVVKIPLADAPAFKSNINRTKLYMTSLLDESLLSERFTNLQLVDPVLQKFIPIGPQEDLSKYDTTLTPSTVHQDIPTANPTTTTAEPKPIDDISLADLGISTDRLPEYYALLITSSDYQFDEAGLPDLEHPADDARRLAQVLGEKYGFEQHRIHHLNNATKRDIIKALEDLSSTIDATDNLLIFYAGHGFFDKAKDFGYWLPSDAQLSDRSTWLPNSVVKDYFGAIKSKHTLLIADACFSGSIFKSRDVRESSLVRKFSEIYGEKSRKAITSGNLTSVPDKSYFFESLLKKLESNNDVFLSAQLLFSRILEPILHNTSQVPQFGTIQNVGDEGGDFVFIRKK